MSYQMHKNAGQIIIAKCAVLTLSDSRTEADDSSGQRIVEMLQAAGHVVTERIIVREDPDRISAQMDLLMDMPEIDVILTTGGTGIAKRDQTIGVIEQKIVSHLPGFGELFRMLSWEQIGSGAMLSRAIAGIAAGKIIFAIPGSLKAVELAMEKLILPEVGHLIYELRK